MPARGFRFLFILHPSVSQNIDISSCDFAHFDSHWVIFQLSLLARITQRFLLMVFTAVVNVIQQARHFVHCHICVILRCSTRNLVSSPLSLSLNSHPHLVIFLCSHPKLFLPRRFLFAEYCSWNDDDCEVRRLKQGSSYVLCPHPGGGIQSIVPPLRIDDQRGQTIFRTPEAHSKYSFSADEHLKLFFSYQAINFC